MIEGELDRNISQIAAIYCHGVGSPTRHVSTKNFPLDITLHENWTLEESKGQQSVFSQRDRTQRDVLEAERRNANTFT